MRFAFDPDKDIANREKHGVGLAFGEQIFADVGLLDLPTFRPEDAERRFKAIGMVGERLWTAVYVERGDAIRLISVRRSNGSEERSYHRHPG